MISYLPKNYTSHMLPISTCLYAQLWCALNRSVRKNSEASVISEILFLKSLYDINLWIIFRVDLLISEISDIVKCIKCPWSKYIRSNWTQWYFNANYPESYHCRIWFKVVWVNGHFEDFLKFDLQYRYLAEFQIRIIWIKLYLLFY